MKVKCYWKNNEQYYSATTAIRINTLIQRVGDVGCWTNADLF